MNIVDETIAFTTAALEGDIGVASLKVRGTDAESLSAFISPGRKPSHSVPMGSMMRVVNGPLFDRQVLVELVVRMQRLRWHRWDAYALALAPPDTEGWRDIHELIGVVPQHGPGWHDLVLAAAAWIPELGGEIRTTDLSEKFGSLSWHCYTTSDRAGDIVAAAEHLSDFICDRCGAPGGHTGSGWIFTRCTEHDHA